MGREGGGGDPDNSPYDETIMEFVESHVTRTARPPASCLSVFSSLAHSHDGGAAEGCHGYPKTHAHVHLSYRIDPNHF